MELKSSGRHSITAILNQMTRQILKTKISQIAFCHLVHRHNSWISHVHHLTLHRTRSSLHTVIHIGNIRKEGIKKRYVISFQEHSSILKPCPKEIKTKTKHKEEMIII